MTYYVSVSYAHPEGYCSELDNDLDAASSVGRSSSGMGFGAWGDERDLQYEFPTAISSAYHASAL